MSFEPTATALKRETHKILNYKWLAHGMSCVPCNSDRNGAEYAAFSNYL